MWPRACCWLWSSPVSFGTWGMGCFSRLHHRRGIEGEIGGSLTSCSQKWKSGHMFFPAWWPSNGLPQMRSPPYLFQCQAEGLFCPGSAQFLHATFNRVFLHVLGSSGGQRWPMCPTWDSLSREVEQTVGGTVCGHSLPNRAPKMQTDTQFKMPCTLPAFGIGVKFSLVCFRPPFCTYPTNHKTEV